MTSFPPWLANVEANLESRKCIKSRVFVLAFHLGLSRWERISSHDIQTRLRQSWRPMRQVRWGAMTRLQSRFPGTRRSVPRPSVKTTPRWETIIHQCRTKFAPSWASRGGKQEYVRFGGTIVWFPNLLPPGQARVESLCNPTGTSIPTSSKVAHPKPVLETSNAQLQNAQARDLPLGTTSYGGPRCPDPEETTDFTTDARRSRRSL